MGDYDEFDGLRCKVQDDTLKEVVARVQKLVDQFHDADKRLLSIDTRLEHIEKDVASIKGQWSKVLITIVGAIGLAVLNFILKGGLVK